MPRKSSPFLSSKKSFSLEALRSQVLRLCGDNLFLAPEVKAYWLERIPREPRAVVEYLVGLFSNFEKDWKGAVHEQLMNDKEGKFKQAFDVFKKSQMHRFSESSHQSEEAKAEADLEKSLNDLSHG